MTYLGESIMSKQNLITPRKLPGFWELMPKEQIFFSRLLNTLESVFQNNCFVPLDTPVLEYSDALLAKSGGETDKEVYRFTKGSTDMCMRYDFTVPLARFVAMHKDELNFPFKRYQIGKNYRGERPQKGRFREFYQCDADIIGNETLSMVADAECVKLYEDVFGALNLDIDIAISNRKILNGIIQEFGKEDKSVEILTALDKIAKIPFEEEVAILKEIGLSDENCEKITKLAKICGKFEEIMPILRNFSKNETFLEGLGELEELDRHIKSFGVRDAVYDLSIIRGHNYYTGTVFEVFLKNRHDLGALGGGGRYENLCGYFTEKKMPGVGMSVGVTRLFDLLKQEYFKSDDISEIDVAIITFNETFDEGLKLVNEFRKNNIKAETFYELKSFKSQMKEANRRKIKYVIILGEDEIKSKLYTLKNMQTSSQEQLSFEEISKKLKSDRM